MVNSPPHEKHPWRPTRLRMARFATFAGFFQLGALMFTWSTGTSPLRSHLGFDGESGDSQFGLIALAIGVGAALGAFVIGPVIDRYGPRRVVSLALVLHPLSIIPLAYLHGLVAAMAAGAVLGLCRGASDTAINAHGVQVERLYRRPIMSAFHAAYPAGGFVAGLIGSALGRQFTESPAVLFTAMGLAMAAVGLVCARWLLSVDEVPPAAEHEVSVADASRRRSTLVVLIMVGFGVLLLASMLSEGAVADWGQEFVRREVGTSVATAGLAISLYSGAQFAGRVFGDRLTQYVGPIRMVAASGVIAAAGVGIIAFTSSATLAMVGFVLIGLGLASMAPLMLSSAGRIDPDNAGRNIGLVNALGYSGMLVGPASITLVVSNAGLAWMPIIPFGLMLLIALCGPLLMRFAPRYGESSPPRQAEPAESQS